MAEMSKRRLTFSIQFFREIQPLDLHRLKNLLMPG
jgi:hypothetical protein